jgi:hypothetical protein
MTKTLPWRFRARQGPPQLPLREFPIYRVKKSHYGTGGLKFLSYHSDMARDWKITDGFREVVQNWLDQANVDSQFKGLNTVAGRNTDKKGETCFVRLQATASTEAAGFELNRHQALFFEHVQNIHQRRARIVRGQLG